MTWMKPAAASPAGLPTPGWESNPAHGFAALEAREPEGVALEDGEGNLCFINDTLPRLLGLPSPGALLEIGLESALARFDLFDADGKRLTLEQLPLALVRQGQQPPPLEFEVRGEDGEERWLCLSSLPLPDTGGGPQILHLLSAFTGHKRAVRSLKYLANASAVLVASLDYTENVPRLARQLVPGLADGCVVAILDEEGLVQSIATAYADPDQQAAALAIQQRFPNETQRYFSQVLQSGLVQLTPHATREMLQQASVDEEHFRLMCELEIRASLTLPLIARGRTLGALSLVYTDSGRRFDETTLALAKELAARLALAVDDARLVEDLQRSEERLHLALREGRMWYLETDLRSGTGAGTGASLGVKGIRSVGTPLDAGVGRTLHPEDLGPVQEKLQRLTDGRSERENFAYRVLDADGQIHWMDGISTLIRDGRGRPIRTVGVRQDVSERRHAEETLRRSEERLRLALEAGKMGFFDHDLSTNKLYASPDYEAMTGFEPGTFTFPGLLQRVHPEDREEFIQRTQQKRLGPDPLEVEALLFRILHPDGAIRWIEIHGRLVCNENHQPLRVIGVVTDITRRQEASVKLRESEERLRLVLSAGKLGFFDQDLKTGKAILSDTYEALLGLEPGGYDGTFEGFVRHIHPEDVDAVMGSIQNQIENIEGGTVLTFRVIDSKGHVRWLESHSEILRDAKRHPFRALGAVLDITERKAAEAQGHKLAVAQAARAEAESAQQRLAAILDSISEPLLTLDATWHLRFLNRSAVQLLGEGRGGQSLKEVPFFQRVPELLSACRQALQEDRPVEQEISLLDDRWYEVRACPYDEGLSVYLRDITARKREQEIQAQLADYEALRADIGTTLALEPDSQRALQRCTEALVQRLGLCSAQFWQINSQGQVLELQAGTGFPENHPEAFSRIPMGDGPVGLIATERKPYFTNHLLTDPLWPPQAPREGLSAFAGYPLICGQELLGVLALFSRTAIHREVQLGLGPLVDAIANGIGRRRAEQALTERAAQLARSNSELEQFAYVASHDLQEPLRVISSFTQLLAQRYQGNFDEKADRYTHFVVDAAARMQRLIQDLLAYSRVGTETKELGSVKVDSVLQRALFNLQAAVEESHAQVTFDALPNVIGDELQLEQLFQNLVGNALKFHGEKPPSVHVSVQREGADWRFSVSDNGIGLAPQFKDRIFVIFQRLHGKGRYSGTGIGLAICKKIVERHGGRIWVESTPGQGATFLFTLPAAKESPAPTTA